MRAVVQRVHHAKVTVEEQCIASIDEGLLIFLGVGQDDTQDDADYLVKKITQLRIFEDEQHKMNKDVNDIHGECLSVSQFTLMANTKRGNRPSFGKAAHPDMAYPLYCYFNEQLQQHMDTPIQTGQFGADMLIDIENNGPVTICFDTKEHK